jgi:hypothetical protein
MKKKIKGAVLIHRETFASDKEFERFKKNAKAQKYADKLAEEKKIKSVADFREAFEGIKHTYPSGLSRTQHAPIIVEDKPKKLRRKNITTKYLKSQEPELWAKVEESVSRDMAVRRTIHNSDKNREFKVGLIPIEYVEAIAHNAAFIAVSEHLKRTRK